MKTLSTTQTKVAAALLTVLTLGACMTSPPADVPGLTEAIGTSLPGAKGLTIDDQNRIDIHVARACKSGVYSKTLCDQHTKASKERRTQGQEVPTS